MNNVSPESILRDLADDLVRPDGRAYKSLSLKSSDEAARLFSLSRREVERLALGHGIVPERYARNLYGISPEDQAALLSSRVLLVGLGGLGGTILEILARLGVGRIVAADGDVFAESNLNRQLCSTERAVGTAKAAAAMARARAVNAAVEVTAHNRYLDEKEMAELMGDADLVVDALGGLGSRPALRRAASRTGRRMVTGGVAGLEGFVSTVFPGDASPFELFCGSGSGHQCSSEDALGCLAPAVSTVASLQCAEAVRILSGREPKLRGRMLYIDLVNFTFDMLPLPGASEDEGRKTPTPEASLAV